MNKFVSILLLFLFIGVTINAQQKQLIIRKNKKAKPTYFYENEEIKLKTIGGAKIKGTISALHSKHMELDNDRIVFYEDIETVYDYRKRKFLRSTAYTFLTSGTFLAVIAGISALSTGTLTFWVFTPLVALPMLPFVVKKVKIDSESVFRVLD